MLHPERPSPARSPFAARWATNVLLIAAALTAAPQAAAEWYVLCERATGDVVLADSVSETEHMVLAGPLPGPRTATVWTDENCPSRRCDTAGRCTGSNDAADDGVEPEADSGGGGWIAGELTTVTVGGSTAATSPRQPGPTSAGPTTVSGPGSADLTPLIETARAAVEGCSYPAALAAADHMANFAPDHPWLQANHDTLRRLADRQRASADAVWRASSALEQGDLKRAQTLAMTAADSAVSCQTQAVSALVTGIDTALAQQRAARSARNRRAAAALLPGLLDLARIASGGQASPGAPGTSVGALAQSATATIGGVDACAFRLEYTDPATIVPTCLCPGYVFDPRSFRCARP